MARAPLTDRLADQMAEGCPSVIEAARRLKVPVVDAERASHQVRRARGPQAR